jgi:tRNA(fMet)-specific endonuclease VapC
VFVVLDTNHFTEFVAILPLGQRLKERMLEAGADYFFAVVTAQEVIQGWLAIINREPAGPAQVFGYSRFEQDLANLSKFALLSFDSEAVEKFIELKRQAPRIGTMDLKIAAICIAHDAMLLTRNLVDFGKVPGLRVENWLG